MATVAFFPGSFDPLTNGHVDVIAGALDVADRLVVAVGIHPAKKALFTPEDRVEMIREVVAAMGVGADRVTVIHYGGLLVDAARAAGATLLVRGIRDSSDADAELPMAAMNRDLAPDLRTILLPASAELRHISATLVRQVAEVGGDVSPFVPSVVARRLAELR